MGMLLNWAHILDRVQKLQLFMTSDQGLDINPEHETCYTTQYQTAFLKYVENEYWAKHRHLPVIKRKREPRNNLFPSTTAAGSSQSAFDRYDSFSVVEECSRTTMWLKRHPDGVIMQHIYWQLQGSIVIHCLNHKRTGGMVIQILMITTPTPWRLAVHFGYWISPAGGVNKWKQTQSTAMSPMWHTI